MEPNTLTIERVFDAPVAAVWKAWSDPEALMRWWGPRGFTSPACTMDFRVGGKYLNCMRSIADGKDYWSTGTYKEIVPMQRIVVTDSFADKDGNVVPASYYDIGLTTEFPIELQITILFEELPNGKTKMTLHHVGMPAGKDGEGAVSGWNESFDKLAESLPANKVS